MSIQWSTPRVGADRFVTVAPLQISMPSDGPSTVRPPKPRVVSMIGASGPAPGKAALPGFSPSRLTRRAPLVERLAGARRSLGDESFGEFVVIGVRLNYNVATCLAPCPEQGERRCENDFRRRP